MIETYVALPVEGRAPGILLLPPVFGIEPVIQELADRYAARGFVVAVPNQFHRDAEPEMMERTDEGRARALARAQRVDVDQIVDDVRAEVVALRAIPQCTGKIGVVGFCFGGRYAFLAAARLDVDAAAAFHPVQIGNSLAAMQTRLVTINQRLQNLDDAKRKYDSLVAQGDRTQACPRRE